MRRWSMLVSSLAVLVSVVSLPGLVSSQGGENDQCACDGQYCTVQAADVIVVLDESPSMRFDRSWVSILLRMFDKAVREEHNVGTGAECPNRYAIFGFGREDDGCPSPVQRQGSPDVFMRITDIVPAFPKTAQHNASQCEDGYAALAGALNARRRATGAQSCVKPLVLLVTDEDRARCGCSVSPSKKKLLRTYLKDTDVEVAMVVDHTITSDGGVRCLGMLRNGTCYMATQGSYFSTFTGGKGTLGRAFGKTNSHYTKMALKKTVHGSVWDIKMVRSGKKWNVAGGVLQQFRSAIPVCGSEPTEPPTRACPSLQAPANGDVQQVDAFRYTVSCRSGYALSGSGSLTCLPTGQYSRTMPSCVDADECNQSGSCPVNTLCVNTDGSYRCECGSGFVRAAGGQCENVNECDDSAVAATCHVRATCVDTPGSYSCMCRDGYTGDGVTRCGNQDECANGADNCDAQSTACRDSPGGFDCTCLSGYSRLNRTHCQNIDECRRRIRRCHRYADCVDTPGSAMCVCQSGYTGDGDRDCANINECAVGSGLSSCDQESTRCRDTEGSFSCSCRPGFARYNTTYCQNIDECSGARGRQRCHRQASCMDIPGSFVCVCGDGFSGDGVRTCSNVDECSLGMANCGSRAVCRDTMGSFLCQCSAGYGQLNKTHCSNIDECTMGLARCHSSAVCEDTDGSYTCQCPSGFVGDGVTTCASGCQLDSGAILPVGAKSVVHTIHSQPPDAPAFSACVAFVVTVGDSGGLPAGIEWIPTYNISQRLDSRAQELGFMNNRFCLITDGAAAGTTVPVGGSTACGSPQQLDTVLRSLRSNADPPTLGSAMDGQLDADSTCAGRDGFFTIVITLLPQSPAPEVVLRDGVVLQKIVDRNGVMMTLGALQADHAESEEYVIGVDYNNNAYEGHESQATVIRHGDGQGYVNNEASEDPGYALFASSTLESGGILIDSTWITDPDGYYLASTNALVVNYFGTALENLRDASCSTCTCVSAGNVQCGERRHVIVPSLCRALYGSV